MDRTWELLTKAASSRAEGVRVQIDAQRDSGNRSGCFERLSLEDEPREAAASGSDHWRTSAL